ncbi:enoyl-CoA hydratase-related protein [Sporosarcina sp. FSL W7-1349]|uniref:enoyl-CoA hydratase-related protein n=1 Tax=Sporosarcina sp. FSL W7-1349 TaxID=2921561 RepID=UPI0030F89B3F
MKTIDIVDIEIKNEVAILTIENPPVNTISNATMASLNLALDQVEKADDVKVVLLRGANGHFMAGAELKEFNEIETKAEASRVSYIGHHLMNRIEFFKKPVIALIEGACLGGGLELALACHMRIGSSNSQYGFPEITLGIIPGAGGTQRLPKLIGIGKARYYILSGERIRAEQAEALGIIDRVVEVEELLEAGMQWAEAIAKNSRIAIHHAMDAMNTGLFGTHFEGYNREAERFGECFETEDKKEGVAAFLEKREPKFRNC